MLLVTVVYDEEIKDFVEDINEIKQIFELKNIQLGFCESISNKNHFIKVYCKDEECENISNMFNLYLGNYIYNLAVEKFCNEELGDILYERYFFPKQSEVKCLINEVRKALTCDKTILDTNTIYYINRKNDVIEKIINCIKENNEININGIMTFRMKEIKMDFDTVIEKVVEQYLSDKEYSEFVKLLKYFVQVQESKMDEVNIIIDNEGKYYVKNKRGEDILDSLIDGLVDTSFSGTVSLEDVIISGLITNVPKRIVIHCVDNCRSNEMIDTIKDVFLERVAFCEGCEFCKVFKNKVKV